jgi:ribosomal protein S18 acetylase RimI-like enzyme
VARTEAGLAGVQVCIPLRGAGGLFWLPEVDSTRASPQVAPALVQAALTWLRQGGAKIAQALVATSDLRWARPLSDGGFQHITQLDYLRHDLKDVPSPPQALDVETYTSVNAAVFAHTLMRTYEGTLDCPELNGVRTIDEVIDGHRAQGIWKPETWWLVRVQGSPAGVVLLTELRDDAGWDLSYVGVVPEFRGRGLGEELTRRTIHSVRAAGGLELHVAVDRRNLPARRLYEKLGFVVVAMREVFLHIFR